MNGVIAAVKLSCLQGIGESIRHLYQLRYICAMSVNTLRTGEQICVFNTVKLGTTPQGGMFPEVSHPQALLGSLVSIS